MTEPPTPPSGASAGPVPLPPEVRRGLPALVLGRLVGNIGSRFPYPFLPAIARGLGVSPEAAGLALSVRELAGLTGPFAGRFVDGGRRRAALVAGLGTAGLVLTLTAGAPGFVLFIAGITAFGVAKVFYDTAMATWIGHHVPWERRGAVIGIGELAWAGSLFLGIPLIGLAIDTWGWRSAFLITGVANMGVALVVRSRVAPDDDASDGIVARLRLMPGAIGLYATMGLLSFGMQLVVVSHGFWLEDAFGWSVSAIGAASIVLGFGELLGTILMIAISDRVGKRRSLLTGACVLVVPLALLGTGSSSAAWAVALLAVSVATFEFAFVSAIPLTTEIDPDARGAGIGTSLALITITRALGTVGGATIYSQWGMGWTGAVAALCIAAAAIVVAVAVREPS